MFKFNSRKIVLIALFIALNVIVSFSAFEITFASWKVSLSITVCFFSGLFTGFIGGALTGLLGDVLGYVIMPPAFAFNPLLSLTSMFWGLVPGLVIDLYKVIFRKKITLGVGVIICCISQLFLYVVVSLGINALILWQSYYSSLNFFKFLVIERLLPSTLNVFANLLLSITLFCAIYKSPSFKEYLDAYKVKDKVKE